MKIHTPEHFKDMPWKNGKGVTTELYRYPTVGEFKLRISQAIVTEDGPFSHYPGIDRHLTILKGRGLELQVDGTTHLLTQSSAPFFFKGEASISSSLIEGPVLDFNVMIDRNWGNATVKAEHGPTQVKCQADLMFILTQENQLLELRSGEEALVDSKDFYSIEIKKRGP